MEHGEFVQAWNTGKLLVDVDRTKALYIAGAKNLLPNRYRYAHIFWSWIWILTIPAAFVVMYYYTWWAGLLILFFVTPIISKATKRSAMQFMIDYALENPAFYAAAVEKGVIRVRFKT